MVLPATLTNCSPCWRGNGDRRAKRDSTKYWIVYRRCSFVFYRFGTFTFVLDGFTEESVSCSLPILQRVLTIKSNDGQNVTSLHQQAFRITHLILIVGLILAIVGGVDIIPTNSANEISTGTSLRKAGSILLLVGWLISLGMNVLFLFRLRHIWEGDRPLVYFGLASEPFLLVRLIYLLALCFATNSKVFSTFDPNIWTMAFMQVVMEFIVFIFYCCAGIITPGIRETTEHDHAGDGPWPGRGSKHGQDSELGVIPGRR